MQELGRYGEPSREGPGCTVWGSSRLGGKRVTMLQGALCATAVGFNVAIGGDGWGIHPDCEYSVGLVGGFLFWKCSQMRTGQGTTTRNLGTPNWSAEGGPIGVGGWETVWKFDGLDLWPHAILKFRVLLLFSVVVHAMVCSCVQCVARGANGFW